MFAALFALIAFLLAAPHTHAAAAAPASIAHLAPASTTAAAEAPAPAAPRTYFPQTWTPPIPFPDPQLPPAGPELDTGPMCTDPIDCPPTS